MNRQEHFYSHFFRFEFWLSFALAFVLFSVAHAADVPQSFTLDGRLYSDNTGNTALVDNNIVFTVQIMDQAKTCVIYEESQTISTIASNGYFSVQVGSIVGDSRRTINDVGNSMATIFQNTAAIPGKLSGSLCSALAVSGSRRYVRVLITPTTLGGGARVLSPDLALDSVPSAVIAERAESLEGLRGSDFLKVNNGAGVALTQTNLESVFASTTRFNALTALINGTSTSYMTSNATGGAQLPVTNGSPTSPSPGAMWFDSVDGKMKYQNSSGAAVIVGAGNSGTVTSVGLSAPTSEFTITGAPVTSSGTIGLSWTNQAAGTVFAAPAVGAGTPSFRALVASDIPSLSWSKITTGLPTTLSGYGINASIGDLKTTAGAQQFSSASCLSSQTLTWSSLTDTFTCSNIAVSGAAITSGTVAAARLPASASAWVTTTSDVHRPTGYVGIGTTVPTFPLSIGDTVSNDGGIIAQGIATAGAGTSLPVSGNGTRMIWYPKSAAFRAGYVYDDEWDDLNIGMHSAAFGDSTIASGESSLAAGYGSKAGDYSIATGFRSETGQYAIATGYFNIANDYSYAGGHITKATGPYSIAHGYIVTAAGDGSTAFGQQTKALGDASFAVGDSAEAQGDYSQAIGYNVIARADYSYARGSGAQADAENSTAIGSDTTANGEGSVAIGHYAIAQGDRSFSIGHYTTSSSYAQLTIGQFNEDLGGNASSWVPTEPLFIIGNSDNMSPPSNAMVVLKNGNTGFGVNAPSERLHVRGNLRVQGTTDCTLGNGSGGTSCSSDARLKDNIREIEDPLLKLMKLRGVEFDWNAKSQSPGAHAIGVIAQDVEAVFPTAVMTDPLSGYKKVDYAVLVAPLIESVKVLDARVQKLEAENAELKNRLDKIEKALQEK